MEEFELLLSEKLGSAFEAELEGKISEFGGLLTRRAALMLLCSQNGISVEKKAKLGALPAGGMPFSFSARVERIFPVQSYQTGTDRSVRLHLEDGGEKATLVLWNEQVRFAEEELCAGDEIACSGAYLRGSEIQVGRSGSLKRVSGSAPLKVPQLTAGICSVEGTVGEVEPDYVYVDKKTGQEKSLSSFLLCEGRACRRVVAWSFPQGAQKPSEGDVLRLESVVFKNGELHLNASSRMVRKSSSNDKEAFFGGVFADAGGKAVFEIGGEKYALPVEEALLLLGIRSVPEGVSPATLLSIKSQQAAGKKAKFTLREGRLCAISFLEK